MPDNEITAGRAAMPDRDAEISQEAARAMLAALRLAVSEERHASRHGYYWRSRGERIKAFDAAIALAERAS